MNELMMMKQQLICAVQNQMSDLHSASTEELGAAVDMIKDLSEAIYYCTITESMEDKTKNGVQYINYYSEPSYREGSSYRYPSSYKEDYSNGRDDFGDRMMRGAQRGMMGNRPMEDRYLGRSAASRKMYMESKEMHHDKSVKMQELERYMKELTGDLVEMIEDSSPEEKQLLQQKLTVLTNKIAQVNV